MAQDSHPGGTAARPGGETTTLPLSYPRSARFTTDEGTWLSLDVSPDGRTIVFDLAGDLYTLPIGGGRATRITDGPGYDAQPRFSSDGTRVVFVSDRSGAENLYTVQPDGQDVQPLTTGEGNDYVSPTWMPDGKYVVVAGGMSGLSLYHTSSGMRTALTGNASPAGSSGGGIIAGAILGPAVGSDGRYLYFSVRDPGVDRVLSYTRGGSWRIQRYDFETGEQEDVASAPGGAFRPVLSPDGKWLVYATRHDTLTSLKLFDLTTHDERWLIHGVQWDNQEALSTPRDVMPGSAFTPDSKAILTAFNGKIWRVEVPSGKATQIPFTADVDVQLGELARFEYPINDTVLTVRQIRDPRLSPDHRRVVFSALDRLYVMELPNGPPRRLTTAEVGEFQPVWSPDGQWIAYVTWNDTTGAVYRVRADGRTKPQRLTRQRGFYRRVNYDPSGQRLVVIRADEPLWVGYNQTRRKATLVWLPARGGDVTPITPLKSDYVRANVLPYFVRGDTSRVYFLTESFRWDGSDRRSHLARRENLIFSPDGTRLFRVGATNGSSQVELGTTPNARYMPFELVPPGAPVVGRAVGEVGAEFTAWSPDGRMLTWAIGRHLFVYDVTRGDSAVADSVRRARAGGPPATGPAYEAERFEITITRPKDRPQGVVVLRNARIITMRGDEVLERGDLVVTNNRITAVGPSGGVRIPAGARVFDLAGKTLIPGFVDLHAHLRHRPEIHPRQPWSYAAALAYGVTTARDPNTGETDVLTYHDRVETGDLLGPRLFSTGPAIGGYDGDFSTLESTRRSLHRYARYYQTQTIKQYLVGDRKKRQHVLMVAKELKLTPTLEGGADFKKNITEAIDGYAGNEHTYKVAPLYRDMVEILARSGITYTPTLVVNNEIDPMELMYQRYHGMHDDRKLRRFVPHHELDRRFLRRDAWFADSQYGYRRLAAQAAKIVRAGGRVALGGHGELSGLGEHWELWLLQSGGMTNLEALRCATLFGAEAIGHGRDLGSLEVGKLADLVVLDKNPLEDIHHSLAIRYVMKNGRLYDGQTLDEVWPRTKAMPRGWWMESEHVVSSSHGR